MSDNQVRIAVLLAAYNGIEFIEEQLQTILYQKAVDVSVFISVDLSTDDSYQLCCEFADRHPQVVVLPYGQRFGGAAANFYRLIQDVNFSDFDYIALSDQDDIWFENKLSIAIENIGEKNLGGYSSNVIAFWANGKKKIIRKHSQQRELDHIFSSPGPGCTHVLTRELLQDFKKTLASHAGIVVQLELHDWVIYAFARQNNYKWWIDPNPGMYYRQHGNNEFGANSGVKTFYKRWVKARDGWYSNQVTLTAELCGVLNTKPIEYLKSNRYIDKLRLSLMVFDLRRKKTEALLLAVMLIIPGFK